MKKILSFVTLICLGLTAMAQKLPSNTQFWTGVGQLVAGGSLSGYSFYRDCTTYNGTTTAAGSLGVKYAHLYTWPITGEIFGAATAVFGIYDVIAGASNFKKDRPVSHLGVRQAADASLMLVGVGAAIGGKFMLDEHSWWVETTLEGGEVSTNGDREWTLPMAMIGVGAILFNYGLERFVLNTSRKKGSSKVSLQATPMGIALVW